MFLYIAGENLLEERSLVSRLVLTFLKIVGFWLVWYVIKA